MPSTILYKRDKRYKEARAAYEKSIELGIDDPQEVYSNLGVLHSDLHDAERAAEMYRRALEIAPDYVPALFNLAGLFESAGDRDKAIELYRKILAIEPGNHESRARIVNATRITSSEDALLADVRDAIESAGDDRFGAEALYFALGKGLDELGRYDEAFSAYKAGNDLGKLRGPQYDRAATERAFDQLIDLFDTDWIRDSASRSEFTPIFICGLFRSGSTLTEQVLASHPDITPGGELDLLPWLLARRLAPYPQGARNATKDSIREVAEEYQAKAQELLPDRRFMTDKRPDNFLHLGLIKAMFPSAKIVYTRRHPLDNCLSLYFQPLGGALGYTTELGDIAHYYQQHERLISHWQSCLGDSMQTVDYDEFVRTPEPVVRRLLEFLDLDWDERCLDFTSAGNLVKTASVWQVRGEMHSRSSGRWRNYASQLGPIRDLFEPDSR